MTVIGWDVTGTLPPRRGYQPMLYHGPRKLETASGRCFVVERNVGGGKGRRKPLVQYGNRYLYRVDDEDVLAEVDRDVLIGYGDPHPGP